MKETIVVCGSNGYIGNALVLRLLSKGYKVVGIDNDIKEKWVGELGSISAIPTLFMRDKAEKLKNIGRFDFYRFDVARDVNDLRSIIDYHKPTTIVNLAQQPSAPYSQKSLRHARETYTNNMIGSLNLLWLIKEIDREIHFLEIESMGTYQPEVGTEIPENLFRFEYKGKTSAPSLFPRRPGSFYHASKVANTYSIDAVNRWWGLKATAINQGIVYGNWTPEIDEHSIHSPLWADECFGTVVNRFIVQMLLEHPLTVYGEGGQTRGFLSLNDSVQCLELLIDHPPESAEMRIINQLDQVLFINDIANKVNHYRMNCTSLEGCIHHIEDPRVECTHSFPYNPSTATLNKLGFKHTRTIEQEIEYSASQIDPYILPRLGKLVMPKTRW